MAVSEIKRKLSHLLQPVSGLTCAYLHGSVLTEYFRPESDIDIALLFIPGHLGELFQKEILHFGAKVEEITGHWGHFSLLSSNDVVFANRVVTKGVLIVCNNTTQCQMFTMHTLSMYANLNVERKEVLDSYTAG